MFDQNKVIQTLSQQAKEDKAVEAVLYVWSQRERAREQVTLRSLKLKMSELGYKFTDEQYTRFLNTLASLEVGKLQRDSKGRIKALTNIRVALQSLGKASMQPGENLKPFHQKHKYETLHTTPIKRFNEQKRMPEVYNRMPKADKAPAEASVSLGLTINIDGKNLTIDVPRDLTPNQLAVLITSLRKAK